MKLRNILLLNHIIININKKNIKAVSILISTRTNDTGNIIITNFDKDIRTKYTGIIIIE